MQWRYLAIAAGLCLSSVPVRAEQCMTYRADPTLWAIRCALPGKQALHYCPAACADQGKWADENALLFEATFGGLRGQS